ncbi:MAG: GSCFA domain-containing protein [Bacteroidales bacterium]|nr:GSCFA domain-containing protein [Bacteroidales bacterium]
MKTYTEITLPELKEKIKLCDNIFLLGSCFILHVGEKLKKNKFNICVNPLGTIYNPASILNTIKIICGKLKLYDDDFFKEGEIYKSFYLHSSIASPNIDYLKKHLDEKIKKAFYFIKNSKWIFITFGSAFVYKHKILNIIVTNCHKQPAKIFENYLLSLEETSKYIENIIEEIRCHNINSKIVFTISPVRYLKYGAFENNLSKATLFLSVKRSLDKFNNIIYFPSYEIFMDELRDYRYYDIDLIHPNNIGIEYLWEKFCKVFFDNKTLEEMKEIKNVLQILEHDPFFKETNEYKKLMKETLQKILKLKEKHPYLDFIEEINTINKFLAK